MWIPDVGSAPVRSAVGWTTGLATPAVRIRRPSVGRMSIPCRLVDSGHVLPRGADGGRAEEALP